MSREITENNIKKTYKTIKNISNISLVFALIFLNMLILFIVQYDPNYYTQTFLFTLHIALSMLAVLSFIYLYAVCNVEISKLTKNKK